MQNDLFTRTCDEDPGKSTMKGSSRQDGEKIMNDSRLLKIGIFYDGNYFYHVSNYYCYAHQRRSRLSISGLHDFIRRYISRVENADSKFCQIVDCHYFRGRLPAMEANARQILLNERMFDDILMREGVVTHYLPVTRSGEKGVDVSLSLEVLELTIYKKFDVVVLIASDGDYVPLVRKLNSLGTRVMVLGWDFEYLDENGNPRYTATSTKMMNEVTYPVWMHKIIDGNDPNFSNEDITSMFVAPTLKDEKGYLGEGEMEYFNPEPAEVSAAAPSPEGRHTGQILQLKNGYGFLGTDFSSKNLFFFWEDLEGLDFNELILGEYLEFEFGSNERGECARHITRPGCYPPPPPSVDKQHNDAPLN